MKGGSREPQGFESGTGAPCGFQIVPYRSRWERNYYGEVESRLSLAQSSSAASPFLLFSTRHLDYYVLRPPSLHRRDRFDVSVSQDTHGSKLCPDTGFLDTSELRLRTGGRKIIHPDREPLIYRRLLAISEGLCQIRSPRARLCCRRLS